MQSLGMLVAVLAGILYFAQYSKSDLSPKMDCRLAGRWQTDKGDKLGMTGQIQNYDGHLQSSGGTFKIQDSTGYWVQGGYRYDNGGIHFAGTDRDGRNKEWQALLTMDDPADPQSVSLNGVIFKKIEPGQCQKGAASLLFP